MLILGKQMEDKYILELARILTARM